MTSHSPIRLVLAAGLALSVALAGSAAAQDKDHAPAAPIAPAQPTTKIPVKTSDDLPRHTYQIDGKASEFLLSDAPFKAFVAKVKADAESDLAKYDIQDRTTLQGYYTLLMQAAIFERRDADAIKHIAQIKDLEAKESKKLMTGLTAGAMIAATEASGGEHAGQPKFDDEFKKILDQRVRALPWDKVKEDVIQAKGRADIISRQLILGQVAGALDPVVEQQKGEVSGELVRNMVGMRATLDRIIDLQPMVSEVFSKVIADAKAMTAVSKDIWTPNQVTLTEGSPVVIGIWDSGVDVSVYPKLLWINEKEVAGNNKDDDGNGFVDDDHGIAFDLKGDRVPGPLASLSDLRTERGVMSKYDKGFSDLNAGVDSPERAELQKYMKAMKPEQVTPFLEDLSLYGGFCHGTHVAGIASAGNPFARIMYARITFDHRAIPTITPSLEQAAKEAKATADTIEYFKKAGVRVVNMSWGGNRESIETALEQKGAGGTPEERAALARQIFNIQKEALDKSMRGAPEILFIAAAGNSDNDNQFSELLPSGLNLPNMITVGAIDSTGKPTGFTTFGKNVTLYANGFEVEAPVPGGEKRKYSGTSMAAPNAANLAGKLLSVNPSLSTQQLIELITATADPMEGQTGRFIINPMKAINAAKAKQG